MFSIDWVYKDMNEYETMMKEVEDVMSKWGWYIIDKKISCTDTSIGYYGPKIEEEFEITLKRSIKLG